MIRKFPFIVMMLLTAAASAWARSPDRENLTFSIQTNVGFGNSAFLVGNHPDIGAWSPTAAVKLVWNSGNNWTGRVAVQKGTELEYKFIVRDTSAGAFCDPGNVAWEPGPNRERSLADAPPASHSGKTIYYYSGWTSASIIAISGTNFPAYPMTRVGDGRTPGESLFKAENVGEEGDWLEFVPNGWLNGTNYWDNAPYPDFSNNYFTRLDAFVLQDGNIYNYWPSNSVSAPYVISNFVNSTVAAITARTIRIYLPRGYDTHTWKRYPVIYMQDGTNVFSPGGPDGSWDADLTATKEISQGRMRETIIVAIDNKANRRVEYNPPGSTYPGEPAGHADKYVKFIADNVMPTLNFNFRTLTDPRNTLVGGSSMGGIFSIYAGFDTNRFGGVLAMSPSFTRAGNYTTSLYSRAKAPIRLYMDTGSNEGQVGITPGGNYWDAPWEGYDIFLRQGFVPNEDLLMRIGCGHIHKEDAWRDRLHEAFRFLLPARDDPNRIAQAEWPGIITEFMNTDTLTFDTRHRYAYAVESFDGDTWNDAGGSWLETNAWAVRSLTATTAPAGRMYFRVTATPRD